MIAARQKTHGDVSNDPADRAQHPHHRKIAFLILQVLERQRSRESQRWHVAQHVTEQEQHERLPVGWQIVQKQRVKQARIGRWIGSVNGRARMAPRSKTIHPEHAEAQHSFAGKEAVGDHAEKERCNDRCQRPDDVGRTGHPPIPDCVMKPVMDTYHAPHTKNCRNIIIDRRVRTMTGFLWYVAIR